MSGVLVIGSGGREHALTRALVRDPSVSAVHVAPGNPGTAEIATNHPVDILDGAAVAALAQELGVGLVIIGPEAPLVAGVADVVRERGIPVFGPSGEAAQLEGSKDFAKQVMAEADVPTAAFVTCTTQAEAEAALTRFGAPHVVKNDSLAAGKGVVVTDDLEAALAHAESCGRVVIEEYLAGPEVSLFAITDGTDYRILRPAQDFKRVGDGNAGLNTGGMGAYCPLPWTPEGMEDEVVARVVEPVLATMRGRGTPFVGLLYVGLALTKDGPKVIEFNARFGDPETEVILPLLETPLGELLLAAATGNLADFDELTWREDACVGVVMAAEGYPGTPKKGGTIVLPPETDFVHVDHAGTALANGSGGGLVADGGRILVVVGRGEDLEDARAAAYAHIANIDFRDGFNRTDIAAEEYLHPLDAE